MKKKVKLFFSLVLLFLSISCLAFGVYAAATAVEYSVGASITYKADNIAATVSKATVTGGDVTSLLQGVDEPMQQINFNKNNKIQQDQVATWDNLLLKFNDAGETIKISFTVTNLNRSYSIKFGPENAFYDYSSYNVNCAIKVKDMHNHDYPDITDVDIPKSTTTNNGYVVVEITFTIINRTKPVNLEGFLIPFNLELND